MACVFISFLFQLSLAVLYLSLHGVLFPSPVLKGKNGLFSCIFSELLNIGGFVELDGLAAELQGDPICTGVFSV